MIQVEPLAGEIFSITTAGSSTSYVVSALRPYTSYLFSVAAITIGRGPATQQIQIQTFTDSEYIVLCISGNLCVTAVSVSQFQEAHPSLSLPNH